MHIVTLSFEEKLLMEIKGVFVEVIPFKTQEPGIIKFGVNAPRSLAVNREEIYFAIKGKKTVLERMESDRKQESKVKYKSDSTMDAL